MASTAPSSTRKRLSLVDPLTSRSTAVLSTRKRLKLSDPSSLHSVASTSASPTRKDFKYDVFLSFRGEDTRKTFVDHLYHALHKKGVITYKDDEKIEKGETINEQLITSIEESRFYIIILSKNYASSSWCLNELVKIMECQRTTEQTAYPVFYDVEPTEVRNQCGAVGEAFEKHVGKEDAERWRGVLEEAAGLAGWELKNLVNGHEAKFVQMVVQDISLKLHSVNISVDENLEGMETRVKKIVSSLEIDSDDFRTIGIKGMGGGGKTTLARAVFNHIFIKFEGKSFVENVRENSEGSGLKKLQRQILRDVLNDKDIDVKSVSDGKILMKKMMRSRKVLVVLDDVDDIKQLEALAGDPNWFKHGSRIIITTRDNHVLVAHGVHYDNIHDVSLLSDEEAIWLFTRKAFKRGIPSQVYKHQSGKVVRYAAGLPLTIEVLGSHLCGRSESEWEDAIKRLKTIPLKDTLGKLEISYNGLEDDFKEIFLDVACILKGEEKHVAIRVLDSCGYNAKYGLAVLEDKCLISISNDGRLLLHNHIEELGRNIVQRLHPHSRLWNKEEMEGILANNLGTEATRSIKLLNTHLSPDIIMKGLRNMTKLRFIYVDNGYKAVEYPSPSSYNNASLPNALQYLYWRNYPLSCLPGTFEGKNLVNLEMVGSKISEIWKGGERKVLNKLKFIDLKYSKLRTIDLGTALDLRTLDLRDCNESL